MASAGLPTKAVFDVLISASIAPTSAAVWVSFTIQYTAPSKTRKNQKRLANSAADRKLSVLNTLVGRKEFISGAANGLNYVEFKAMIDFTAHPADVAFDDAGLRIEMDAPYVFQQHPSGTAPSGLRTKYSNKRNSCGNNSMSCRRAGRFASANPNSIDPELKRTAAPACCRPAGKHPDPSQQFANATFDQVVVAARFQSLDAVVDSAMVVR